MIIFIYFIIAVGIYLSFKKPYYYLVWYGLLGSDMGARGISGFFELFFPSYTLIMRILLVIATFVSFTYILNKSKINNKAWIVLSCWLMMTMLLMLFVDITNLTPSSFISRATLAIAPFGPGIFIVWLAYADEIDHKTLLFTYSCCQCLIAILIIYGVFLGFPYFNVINAGLYNDGYFYLDESNSMVAMPSNFHLAFAGKNEHFIRCGQFHNSNGLGFAAGMLITLLISRFLEDKKTLHRIIYVVLMLVAFLLWCNTGTRGPLVGLFVAVILYCWLNKNSTLSKLVIPIGLIGFLVVLVSGGGDLIDYFIGSGASDSWESRKALNANTYQNISEFFLFGTAGNLDSLHARDIDPHILSLRFMCMYGIIPATLITILTILKPLRQIYIYRKYVNFYSLGLYFTLLLVSLTNNFSENTLFWICFAEFVVTIAEIKQKKINKIYGY